MLFVFDCDDIQRDNMLDPKNPESHRQKIITIEAFVNTHDSLPVPYNTYLIQALDSIENKYQNQVTIAEYHRKVNNAYADGYDSNENEFLYDAYFNGFGQGIKGVPDVFFDGVGARVQGASDLQNAVFRLEEALQPFLIQNSYFTIEPVIEKNNTEINISVKIARLGSTAAEDFIVKAIIVYRINNNLLKRVVHGIEKSTVIEHLDSGEVRDIEFDPIQIVPYLYQNMNVIIMVTSSNQLTVYQSIEVQIP